MEIFLKISSLSYEIFSVEFYPKIFLRVQPSAWESLWPREDVAAAEASEAAGEADRRRLLEVTLPRLMFQVSKIFEY